MFLNMNQGVEKYAVMYIKTNGLTNVVVLCLFVVVLHLFVLILCLLTELGGYQTRNISSHFIQRL